MPWVKTPSASVVANVSALHCACSADIPVETKASTTN